MAKKQIVIKYIFKDDYNPIYATGAFGGVNPSGDIIANFYLERHALPKEMTYDLDGPEPKEIVELREPKNHLGSVVRVVDNGVIFNLEFAKVFHDWLGKKIEIAEKRLKEKET